MRHLLSIADLTRDDVERILETAGASLPVVIVTSSAPSVSSSRTLTRSSRAVGRFLPT